MQRVYPVNSIYIAYSEINPAEIFGFGTWELMPDRFLVGAGKRYTLGGQSGTTSVVLTHKQLPAQSGRIILHGSDTGTPIHGVAGSFTGTLAGEGTVYGGTTSRNGAPSYRSIDWSNGGEGAAHNNMPPYTAVYFWRRTA